MIDNSRIIQVSVSLRYVNLQNSLLTLVCKYSA